SSVFAMGKFGLRGLAQSLARELHPQNIHIGHFIIDGGIGHENYGSYKTIHPDEIAKVYLQFHNQDKSAWSWETQLRTSVEKF
ncbi:oxidoreductase, partial [Candidatus Pelagibacter sp.]|nr:oxidoreductase [Candidatus Pelagibacter sp.]